MPLSKDRSSWQRRKGAGGSVKPTEGERAMAIGPVQLIVLERLRESDNVRVIDPLAAGRRNGHA